MLMTCWICPCAELSWHPPVLAATGGAPPEPTANAVATTLKAAARLDSLRPRLAFTYALRFQPGSHRHPPQVSTDCRLAGGPLQAKINGMAKVAHEAPTLADVVAARDRIRAYLAATPLRNYPSLDRLTGAAVRAKHDNLLPTGASKVRGGVNLISQLDGTTRARGVIAASTGNHGQSVAFASQL